MAEPRRLVCIVCPKGCALEVNLESLAVSGNACLRGEAYGRTEILDPQRSLTTTVRTRGLAKRRLAVRTSGTIPLARLREAAARADEIEVSVPVACGDVLIRNFLDLGVDLVATDSLGPAGEGHN